MDIWTFILILVFVLDILGLLGTFAWVVWGCGVEIDKCEKLLEEIREEREGR